LTQDEDVGHMLRSGMSLQTLTWSSAGMDFVFPEC